MVLSAGGRRGGPVRSGFSAANLAAPRSNLARQPARTHSSAITFLVATVEKCQVASDILDIDASRDDGALFNVDQNPADGPTIAVGAQTLTAVRREPSESKRFLNAFYQLFAHHGWLLTSAEVQRLVTTDPSSEWADYHGHGPITVRQIALILDAYNIHPDVIHL